MLAFPSATWERVLRGSQCFLEKNRAQEVNVELIKDFRFEAAHFVPGEQTPEGRLHGHSYRLSLCVTGPVDAASGWLIDFGEIKQAFNDLYDSLDHRLLNEVDGLADVSEEGVAKWVKERLRPRLPNLSGVRVRIEGAGVFRPESMTEDALLGLPPRVGFGFEAAHRLPTLPDAHKCSRLHGHSFRVEVGAERMEDLEAPLARLYDALDRRNLNEIAGLANATSENLCAWIWERLARDLSGLRVVIVQETCTARCVYRGE
jgi:6-pyruvoyltetrahydropterin/6-carboxytetrahydropterin synthase